MRILKSLASWLSGPRRKNRTLDSLIGLVCWMLVYNLTWLCFGFVIFTVFLFDVPPSNGARPESFLEFFTSAVVYAPLIEEVIFRLLPITFILSFYEKAKIPPYKLTAILLFWGLITSIIFGVVHGYWWNIFFQGVGGIFLWMTFLYASQLGRDVFRGYWASVALHALFNLTVFFI